MSLELSASNGLEVKTHNFGGPTVITFRETKIDYVNDNAISFGIPAPVLRTSVGLFEVTMKKFIEIAFSFMRRKTVEEPEILGLKIHPLDFVETIYYVLTNTCLDIKSVLDIHEDPRFGFVDYVKSLPENFYDKEDVRASLQQQVKNFSIGRGFPCYISGQVSYPGFRFASEQSWKHEIEQSWKHEMP